jgi:K+-dependent Na+/Ca+ exchanger-like protein
MLPFVDVLANPWRTLAYVLCFLIGVALLERGADWFTDAAAALAKRLRAPQTLVGLLTAGGEWEELVVVLAAVIGGHGGIALGDVLGSTIANVLGSFPLGLLARQPLRIERSARVYALGMLLVTLLVSALLFAGPITRPVGGALVALFLVYLASILLAIRRGMLAAPADDDDDDDEAEEREEMERRSMLAQLAFIILGLGLVSLGAWLVVEPAVYFAHALGLPETVIGLTIVAIGTTLPDKAISLAGGLKQQSGIVVANAVGSNIFLLTLTLGLAAFAAPVTADAQTLRFDVPVMIGCACLLWLLLLRQRLHWRVGLLLLLLYAGYLAYQFVGK